MGLIEVAVLQLAAAPGDLAGNRDAISRAVLDATGADLVVAPELVTTGYDLEVLRDSGAALAEPADGPSAVMARSLAARTGAVLALGFLERAGDAVHDSLLVATPAGQVSVYRKSHLYPPERDCFAEGDRLGTIPTPVGTLGPLICFEHAFPEIATALALAGAQVLVIPSAVPFGYEHLLSLRTRARAQDNQLFAVAANLAGHGFCGGSLVVDPRGRVLAEAGPAPTVLRARLDLDEIVRERAGEPALRMRRPELYRTDVNAD